MQQDIRPAATDILALGDDDIGEFLRDLIAQKRLSDLVHGLNEEILEGTAEMAQAAARALTRLGFVDELA
ncbi:hypothetical protein [Dinoroseobacter sp. S375]|uniref:hypothetical protein n=1 Tax=Dinoroseobacter sp. S375 TaxID=3415136 RepID=UPI003C7E34BF